MRRRPRLLPGPILIPVLLACLALARPAAAQHCWPSTVAVAVRDEAGTFVHPGELESYAYTPERPDSSDQEFAVRRLDGSRWEPLVPPGTHMLVWWGRGDCRVYLDEVVLTRGGGVMRLRLNLRLDTDATPGPTEYLVDTPRFAPGTWELALPLPSGHPGKATVVTADRWRRLPDGAG